MQAEGDCELEAFGSSGGIVGCHRANELGLEVSGERGVEAISEAASEESTGADTD